MMYYTYIHYITCCTYSTYINAFVYKCACIQSYKIRASAQTATNTCIPKLRFILSIMILHTYTPLIIHPGITAKGIVVQASCQIKGKSQQMRTVVVPFPRKVDDETMLKTALIVMACNVLLFIHTYIHTYIYTYIHKQVQFCIHSV